MMVVLDLEKLRDSVWLLQERNRGEVMVGR